MSERDVLARIIQTNTYPKYHIDGWQVNGTYEAADEILEAQTTEWEYGWAADSLSQSWYDTKEEAEEYVGNPRHFRRRKASPWIEVPDDPS